MHNMNSFLDITSDPGDVEEPNEVQDWMDPHQLHFTQDSISARFQNGLLLTDALAMLQSETLSIQSLPVIEVVEHGGCLYSLNNRRLWLFKQSGCAAVPVRPVPPSPLFWKRFESSSCGLSIQVRPDARPCRRSVRRIAAVPPLAKQDRGVMLDAVKLLEVLWTESFLHAYESQHLWVRFSSLAVDCATRPADHAALLGNDRSQRRGWQGSARHQSRDQFVELADALRHALSSAHATPVTTLDDAMPLFDSIFSAKLRADLAGREIIREELQLLWALKLPSGTQTASCRDIVAQEVRRLVVLRSSRSTSWLSPHASDRSTYCAAAAEQVCQSIAYSMWRNAWITDSIHSSPEAATASESRLLPWELTRKLSKRLTRIRKQICACDHLNAFVGLLVCSAICSRLCRYSAWANIDWWKSAPGSVKTPTISLADQRWRCCHMLLWLLPRALSLLSVFKLQNQNRMQLRALSSIARSPNVRCRVWQLLRNSEELVIQDPGKLRFVSLQSGNSLEQTYLSPQHCCLYLESLLRGPGAAWHAACGHDVLNLHVEQQPGGFDIVIDHMSAVATSGDFIWQADDDGSFGPLELRETPAAFQSIGTGNRVVLLCKVGMSLRFRAGWVAVAPGRDVAVINLSDLSSRLAIFDLALGSQTQTLEVPDVVFDQVMIWEQGIVASNARFNLVEGLVVLQKRASSQIQFDVVSNVLLQGPLRRCFRTHGSVLGVLFAGEEMTSNSNRTRRPTLAATTGVAIFDLNNFVSSPTHRIQGGFLDFALGAGLVVTLSSPSDPDPLSICVWSCGASLECVLRISHVDQWSRIYVASGAVLSQVKSYVGGLSRASETNAALVVESDAFDSQPFHGAQGVGETHTATFDADEGLARTSHIQDFPDLAASSSGVSANVPLPTADDTQTKIATALQFSNEDAVMQEQADLQSALVRSKGDIPHSGGDEILILKLSSGPSKAIPVILAYLELQERIAWIKDSGCDIQPEWANGATMLYPITLEYFIELDVHLEPHNIVALSSDVPLLQQALEAIPCRKRPKLRGGADMQGGSLQASHPSSSAHADELDTDSGSEDRIEFVVERTFLGFKHVDTSDVTQSEPCGGVGAPQPRNPSGRCHWRA